MFDGFWASFAPAFTIAFGVMFGIMLVIRTVQWTVHLIKKKTAEKKSEVITESLPWVASIAVVLVTIYLRTRDARVTELEQKVKEAEAKIKPRREVVDTGDDDEVRDRFPDNDEVYSRA